MNGEIVPPGILSLDPWWKQFLLQRGDCAVRSSTARLVLAFAVPFLWWKVTRAPGVSHRARIGAHLLLAGLAIQVTLGILTLVHVVPVPLAALHQAGALLLFALALHLAHALR